MKQIYFNIDPYSFTGSAVIIGFLLVNELSSAEQDSVGNWLQLVGLAIQTYSSQVSTLESVSDSTSDENQTDTEQNSDSSNTNDIETIKKAINKIKEELENIKANE